MSLQDKITDELRDDLYGENSNPIKKSIAEFQELNDSLSTPSSAFFTFAVCLFIEGVSIGLQFFARSWVSHFLEKDATFLLWFLGPSVIGFLGVLSACKLWRSNWTVVPQAESDDTPGVGGEPKLAFFFASVGGGILNTLLLWGLHSLWA